MLGRGAGEGAARQPAGGLSAPAGAQAGGARVRPSPGHPAAVSARPQGSGRSACVPRRVLDPCSGRLQGCGRADREGGVMTEQTAELAVRRSITVEAAQDRAFEVFTEGISTWWLLESHHIGSQVPEAAVLEPRSGGRWFERAPDGSECDWGRVIEWEPPHRVLLGWHLGPDWEYDPSESRATEVEVRFIAEGPGTTRV